MNIIVPMIIGFIIGLLIAVYRNRQDDKIKKLMKDGHRPDFKLPK